MGDEKRTKRIWETAIKRGRGHEEGKNRVRRGREEGEKRVRRGKADNATTGRMEQRKSKTKKEQ